MSKQTMTKAQLREAINGMGPLSPDWLVEALEDFIELQEAHKTLLAMHAEDAYHLEVAQARIKELEGQCAEKVNPQSVASDEPKISDEAKEFFNE
jgi:hypothetical protein